MEDAAVEYDTRREKLNMFTNYHAYQRYNSRYTMQCKIIHNIDGIVYL